MSSEKPRYRRFRSDFHTHPRTAGLSPLARDLYVQGVLANIAGVLERSVSRMARLSSSSTSETRAALLQLRDRGLVRWWPELETLWVVEAADEQAQNGKAWKAVATVVASAPPEVQAAVHARYPDQVPPPRDTVSDTVSDTVCPQEQEQEQAPGEGGVGETSPPPVEAEPEPSLRDGGGSAAPAPSAVPRGTPPHEGAAARVLGRHASAREGKTPPEGKRLRWLRDGGGRKTGALLFGGDPARVAPGPWTMPAPVEALLAPVRAAEIPGHEHPPPPRLPHTEDQDALCDAMLSAFRAVYRRRTGRAYSGQVGSKRRRSVAESARYLREAGVSAWVWYDWAWGNEVGRRDVRPSLYSLSAPKLVDRLLDRCRAEGQTRRGMRARLPSAEEAVKRRRLAEEAIRVRRVRDTSEAARIIALAINPEGEATWDELLLRARAEARKAVKRDEIAMRRGVWLWPA